MQGKTTEYITLKLTIYISMNEIVSVNM